MVGGAIAISGYGAHEDGAGGEPGCTVRYCRVGLILRGCAWRNASPMCSLTNSSNIRFNQSRGLCKTIETGIDDGWALLRVLRTAATPTSSVILDAFNGLSCCVFHKAISSGPDNRLAVRREAAQVYCKNLSKQMQVQPAHVGQHRCAVVIPHCALLRGLCGRGGEADDCNLGAMLEIFIRCYDASMLVAPSSGTVGLMHQPDAFEAYFASLREYKVDSASMLAGFRGSKYQSHECYYLPSSTCTRLFLHGGRQVDDTVLSLFGLIHQRWMTTLLSLVLRFNSRDLSSFSSVMVNQYVQLSSQPRVHTPDRPAGEPPTGHQLVWSTLEALGDCRCGTFESG